MFYTFNNSKHLLFTRLCNGIVATSLECCIIFCKLFFIFFIGLSVVVPQIGCMLSRKLYKLPDSQGEPVNLNKKIIEQLYFLFYTVLYNVLCGFENKSSYIKKKKIMNDKNRDRIIMARL